MTAGGKGHARRPTDEAAYSAGYDAIFGRKADNAQMGRSSTAEQAPLTRSVVGSNPTAPANYVDDDSGQAVTEAWWPGDPRPEQH